MLKKLQEKLWKHCYRRNKPEADQSNAPRWRFWFICANWFCIRSVLL